MTLRLLLIVVVGLAALWPAAPVHAQTYCQFTGAAPALEFGQIAANPTAQTDTTANVNVQCYSYDGPVTVKLCLKLNNGSPDTTLLPQRRMANGAARLNYQISRDAARSQVWGDATTAPASESTFQLNQRFFGINFRNITVPMYARVQPGQSGLASGTYQSNLTLNMTGAVNSSAACSTLNNVVDSAAVTARAMIPASCTIDANNLSFGLQSQLGAALDTSTTLGVNCTVGTPYTVRLDGGTTSGNVAARQMALNGSGPGVISYQLRHTSANGPLWGDGTRGTGVVNGTGTGGSQTLPVYGRVPAQATPPVGYYEDTVTATVVY